MSENLRWERLSKQPENRLSKGMKHLVDRRYGRSVTFTTEQLSWLQGVIDATVSAEIIADCEALIEVIREDGGVKLWIGE